MSTQTNTTKSADIGDWSTASTLPAKITDPQAIVTKNRVYLLGGIINNLPSVNVYTAPINLDGTLGSWTTAPGLPTSIGGFQAIVTKNRVYLLGGYVNGSYPSSTVYTAPINPDGTLGDWSTTAPVPGTVFHSQAIVTKNRVYLLGGIVNSGYSSTVYTAPINPDGTLGDWSTAPSLPGTALCSQAIVTKNRVYLLGGIVNSSHSSTTVYTAPINPDGTLGTWATAPSLPFTVVYHQVIATHSRVYLLGGVIDGYLSSAVYTAPINLDGTLGDWSTAPSPPATVYFPQAIVSQNRIYLMGGHNGSSYSFIVYTAPIIGDLDD